MTIMPIEEFKEKFIKLFILCGKSPTAKHVEIYYNEYGNKTDRDQLLKAFRYMTDAPPRVMMGIVFKNAIQACAPDLKKKEGQIGCEYCDGAGLIQYHKVVNGTSATYSARCHKCNTSPYTNLPYYNKVMPHDDIQPHSTKEQMKCGKVNVDKVVRMLTGRQHEDFVQERQRERQLWREQQKEDVCCLT